jgi:hypothetical protein
MCITASCSACQYSLDCITSSNFVVGFVAIPKGLFWGAQGSTLTCDIIGFLTALVGTVEIYNLGLSVYYVLIIRAGMSEEHIVHYVEPFIHILSISMPIGVGIWL